jgi:hypothetical protein
VCDALAKTTSMIDAGARSERRSDVRDTRDRPAGIDQERASDLGG